LRTILRLPFPPSVNGLYDGGKNSVRRFTSDIYKAWQADAYEALLQQSARTSRHNHPVEVTYTFGRPDKRRRDVFNLEKAVSDFLVKHRILSDDALIERGTVQWGIESGVVVHIESLQASNPVKSS
jgi:Holliday junction resolvase RusA-like endonuclease